jgi:ubiquinone/menaquinone biosynthesis C-methylase UbiE
MLRTPEPEVMSCDCQVSAYAAADLSEINEPILVCFRQRFPWFSVGRLIDLGSGAADVSIRFARAYPHLSVLAIDASEAMLRSARQSVSAAGLADRITLAQHHLPDENLPRQAFDAAVANSVLHHMDDPLSLWQTIKLCAKPGAAVLVMDLHRPRDVESAQALVSRYGRDAESILQRDFLNSLCAAYSAEEIREQLNRAGLSTFQANTFGDLHVMAWGIAP